MGVGLGVRRRGGGAEFRLRGTHHPVDEAGAARRS
jgi:hypothetical protein